MTRDDTNQIDSTLALLWEQSVPVRRGPKPGLSLDRIIETAIAIADIDGLAALSMRRVATDLNAGTMSLYRYVRDKEQLIVLAVNRVFGEYPFPESPPENWRERLRMAAQRQWNCYMRHPWIVPLVSMTRPLVAPNAMAHTEWALAALDDTGLDSKTIVQMVLSLTTYTLGAALHVANEVAAERGSGTTADEWMAAQEPLLEQVGVNKQFPMIATHFVDDAATRPEAWFSFGLESMLDGFAAVIEERRSG